MHDRAAAPRPRGGAAGPGGHRVRPVRHQRLHHRRRTGARRPTPRRTLAKGGGVGCFVFVHPWGCSLGGRLAAHYLGNTVGQPVETTVALSHLIFGGVLDRYPRLKLVAAHGGGCLPTYIGRSDHAWRVREDARGCAEPPSTYLRRMWFDALVCTPRALRHLVEEVGADRVVLGTDHPFDMGIDDPPARIDAAGLAPAERAAIAGGNALDLLLKGRTG
ncbi:amidohydrolase family protein [Streptomyces sp. NPDC001260]|uniref:amidohydrolase family protein n=1 Tax=Streptomyces sp. NPDC001260 TaxID=3364551 RepID=UPI00368F15AF